MTARRCTDKSGGKLCTVLMHTWDKHATCLSHRTCTRDNTCTLCEFWEEKQWNAVPIHIKKANHKRKDKQSRTVTRSLVSSQDNSASPDVTPGHTRDGLHGPLPVESRPMETVVSAEVVTNPLQGDDNLTSSHSVTSCSTQAFKARVERNTVSLTGGESYLVTAGDHNPQRAKNSVNTILAYNSGGQTSGPIHVSDKQGPVPACAGSATLASSELHGGDSELDSSTAEMTSSMVHDFDRNHGDRSLSWTTRGSASQLPVGNFASANPNAQQQQIGFGSGQNQWGMTRGVPRL
jgi:hypothetical protein